jgi:F-type H+-transporting ATPase subunit beta
MSATQVAEGKIVQCIGAVIDIQFPREQMPNIYEALTLVEESDSFAEKGLTFEVEQQLGDGVVRTIALGSSDGLRRGMKVRGTGAPISVPVGPGTLGRVMDVLGRPIDERGPVKTDERRSIHAAAPKFDELSPSVELLETGIKVIDLICPFAKGGKIGLFGGAGVGKTVNMLELINNIAKQHSRPVGVRRRGRAHPRGQRLLPRDVRRQGHRAGRPLAVEGGDGVRPDERAPGQPPARGAHGPHHGRALPRRGRDILFFVDNIYRFTLAGTEVSALLGRMPSAVGYQPTLAEEMGRLQERITSTKTGSITSIQAVYVPADDLTDPSPATTFGHLDATVVLSRDIAGPGHLPRRGPARFHLPPGGPERDRRGALHHARRAGRAAALQGTARHHRDPGHGRTLARGQAGRLPRAEDPALPVAAVPRRRGLHRLAGQVRDAQGHDQGLHMIVNGECDSLPEQAFYMVGPIEEAFEKAKTLQ